MKLRPPLSVGVIGGEGRTGGQFARLFRAQGFAVETTGAKTARRNRLLWKQCDIVVFAVPLESSERLMRQEIRHAARPDQLILDLCSLKTRQMMIMAKAKGEVIGRFLDDDASLYGPIILRNPQPLLLLRLLRRHVYRYIRMAERDDLSLFHRTYDSLRAFFGSVAVHARERSEACLRTLSSLTRS